MQRGKLSSWPAPPLEWIGHTSWVESVAYSPDGRHLISGSVDETIRIWDAETGAAVGEPLKGHSSWVLSVAYSPDGRHLISGSYDETIRIWDAETGHPDFCARPDRDGWVKDSNNHLLSWVPSDCRAGLHSPALLTLPLTSPIRSVALDFDDFAFGTSWTQIFKLS